MSHHDTLAACPWASQVHTSEVGIALLVIIDDACEAALGDRAQRDLLLEGRMNCYGGQLLKGPQKILLLSVGG